MNIYQSLTLSLVMGTSLPVSLVAAEPGGKPAASLSAADKTAADKAWKELQDMSKPPLPPAEWAKKAPTEAERDAFHETVGKAALKGAERAKEFYTKYPHHEYSAEAQKREKKFLETAHQYGQDSASEKLAENPLLTEDEKFANRLNQVHAAAMKLQPKGLPAVLEAFEKGIRAMLKDYPNRPELYAQLFTVANNTQPEKAKELLAEIIASNTDEELTDSAKKMLKVMGAVGQPFEMAFTATDGREISIKDLKGKVVLIDFWATWCGPCIQELPNVKKVYDKYHEKGFEILGISFDKQKGQLTSFIKENEMTWPQYFDGAGWGNKFGVEYNISGIPTMWLVDTKGILRDLNAREDLGNKVAKYLAEK